MKLISKPPKWWFQRVKDPQLRKELLEACDEDHADYEPSEDLAQAIDTGFDWVRTGKLRKWGDLFQEATTDMLVDGWADLPDDWEPPVDVPKDSPYFEPTTKTLRDEFAMAAPKEIWPHFKPIMQTECPPYEYGRYQSEEHHAWKREEARQAYLQWPWYYADAMLEERRKITATLDKNY
jgi:hypothetical protein